MKKNTMMRFASVLLVAVLLTTCVISGTFAKYATSDTDSAAARVAKWGVAVDIDATDLFATEYEIDVASNDTNGEAIESSVQVASGTDELVAPGTSGSIDFTITGAPEVAVAVTVEFDVTNDVVIPAGTEIAADTTLDAAYTPVVFTLEDSEGTELATGTLEDIEDAMEALTGNYAPNTTLDKTYTLSWEWAFDGNDVADTYLGNVAAGTIDDATTITEIEFSFTVTVTQID